MVHFTGFKDNPSFPEEQPHSSFPEGSALDGRSCPQSPSLGRAGRLHQAPGPHSRDRQRTLAATSEAPPSHTRPSHERQSVAGHLRAAPYLRLSSVTIQLRDQTTFCGFPAIIWLARPTFLLALARRHNQPLISQFPLQPGSLHPRLSSTLARRVTGRRPTTPHTVVSLRSPGDQLSTSRPQQTQRLGRQVILAQPSASSRGSPSGGTTPHTVGVSFRRHNPGGLLQAAQLHILWGSPLGGTTPHTVVSLRFPGDQLSTSRPQQTKRPGGQVILAQPSASSRGSRSGVSSGH